MYNLKGKVVMVTGGVGFVGAHLVEELIKLEAHIIVVDIDQDKKSYLFINNLHKKVKVTYLNMCNYEKLLALIKKNKVDFVFHLAAQPLVKNALEDPKYTLENNIISTINVLEVARVYPHIKGVVVASSDKAYGELRKKKYIESNPLVGTSPYEVSKSATDLISSSYYKTYKTPVVITRFGNIYGEGDRNFSRVVPGIMKALITKKRFEIRSNGKYVRDYLYVKDVVNGYLLLAKHIAKTKGESFNFGSDDTLTVIEVIRQIEKNINIKIKYKILNSAKSEIPYQSLDYAKIRKTVGWKPTHSFASTALNIYEYYKKFSVKS